ncbi:MAG TPA: succinylglutamate desuccinylase/aspartoacylase family protein, partial [Acidobacteriota bacterium]|nr:succinylglutamate desuccinylase/aspartoacylase family protein [Acidobacteriota bacterium]
MNSEIKIYDSNKPGPTLTIFACVHGNEPCGEKALRQFVFHPSRGRIITVIANIAALRAGKRFIDCDLNRSFTKSGTDALESQTAKILANILDESDALLDIHASSSVKSEPFVICEKHSLD